MIRMLRILVLQMQLIRLRWLFVKQLQKMERMTAELADEAKAAQR